MPLCNSYPKSVVLVGISHEVLKEIIVLKCTGLIFPSLFFIVEKVHKFQSVKFNSQYAYIPKSTLIGGHYTGTSTQLPAKAY